MLICDILVAFIYPDYQGVERMNYNKLWKLLIDKHMKKKDLREAAGITTNTIAKMGKGGDVSTQVLRKICDALDCKIEDIVELDEKEV
jgi:putative transcriptional regulator